MLSDLYILLTLHLVTTTATPLLIILLIRIAHMAVLAQAGLPVTILLPTLDTLLELTRVITRILLIAMQSIGPKKY